MPLLRIKTQVYVLGQKKPVLKLDLDENTVGRLSEVAAVVNALLGGRR